ncbi:MAG: cupredoxin family copper-binding protein [Armatimonadetes bacterium]|nr:cupredoxin family copper-binding protein [Armatimonadota bacterium]
MKPIIPATLTLLAGTALLSATVGGPVAGPSPATAPKAAPSAGKTVQVAIDNFRFTPAVLTVPAGTQVTWRNNDDVPHTVVSTRLLFKSRALDTGDTFSYTFRAKGTYAYFCSVHPMMTAKVIVR